MVTSAWFDAPYHYDVSDRSCHISYVFLVVKSRGRHLNSSVANFGPQGRSTETSNSVLGWGEDGEIDTLILSDSSPMPFNPIQYQPNSIRKSMAVHWNWNGNGGTRLESEKNQGVCFSRLPAP